MIPQIPVEVYTKIVEICRKNEVRVLSLFGSRVRGDFTDSSDYDFLVDFLPEARIDLFQYVGIQLDLEKLLGHKVDLVTMKGLRPSIRERVLSEAKVVYEG